MRFVLKNLEVSPAVRTIHKLIITFRFSGRLTSEHKKSIPRIASTRFLLTAQFPSGGSVLTTSDILKFPFPIHVTIPVTVLVQNPVLPFPEKT